MNDFFKRIFIVLIFLNIFTLFSEDVQLPYKIDNRSNIFIKTFFFYFPISNKYEVNFFYDTEVYSIEITIKRDNINNEPSTPSLFETDLFFRIDNIYYNKFGDLYLPVTIRVNKKVITFNTRFKISQKGKFIYIKGKIKDLKFKDITKDVYFSKRREIEIPIIFDLIVTSNF